MPDFSSFREVARSVTVSYPIPFLFASLLAFGLGCFGIGAIAVGQLAWIVDALGATGSILAMALAAYGVLIRPELLRSERYTLMQRALDVLGNDEMTGEHRLSVAASVKTLLSADSSEATRKSAHTESEGNV